MIEIEFYIVFSLLIWLADSQKISSDQNIWLWILGMVGLIALLCASTYHGKRVMEWWILIIWYSFLAGALVCWGWLEPGKVRLFSAMYCLVLLVLGICTESIIGWYLEYHGKMVVMEVYPIHRTYIL